MTNDTPNYKYWTDVAVTQLGYVVNLLLVLAPVAIGFAVTLRDGCQSWLLSASIILLFFSMACGILCTVTRLWDFRLTRRSKDPDGNYEGWVYDDLESVTKWLGNWTWRLLGLQLALFVLGSVGLAIYVANSILHTPHWMKYIAGLMLLGFFCFVVCLPCRLCNKCTACLRKLVICASKKCK